MVIHKKVPGSFVFFLITLIILLTSIGGAYTGASIFTGNALFGPKLKSEVKLFTSPKVFDTYAGIEIKTGCDLLNVSTNFGRFLPGTDLTSIHTAHDYCAAKGYQGCMALFGSSGTSYDCSTQLICNSNLGECYTPIRHTLISCCNFASSPSQPVYS